MFDHNTKHLKVHQNYLALHHIFNSLFGVWKCIQTWSFMLDILRGSSLRTDLFEISVWLLLVIINFQQWHFELQIAHSNKFTRSFYSLVVLVAEQWEKVAMCSIVEVTIFDVQSFPWWKDALIHHFQGTLWPVTKNHWKDTVCLKHRSHTGHCFTNTWTTVTPS